MKRINAKGILYKIRYILVNDHNNYFDKQYTRDSYMTPQKVYTKFLITLVKDIVGVLWFLCKTRINLSPFTKDFRAEEQIDESKLNFSMLCLWQS